jgi:hypothetical protein
MYRLTTHRQPYDNCLRLAISPVRNANFVWIKHQFSQTPLDVFFQVLNSSLQEHSGYLQTLLFLRGTFRFGRFGLNGDERTNSPSRE